MGELRLVDAPDAGARLSDDALAAALDPGMPRYAELRSATDGGTSSDLLARLGRHYRGRDFGTWMFDERASTADADAIARGEIEIHDVRHAFPGGEIDWTFNPTRYTEDLPFNRQWELHLNRMDFWRDLARGYRETGDERYARAWSAQLRGFLDACPYDPEPDIRQQSSHWSTLRAAIRMATSWPDAFVTFLRSEEVDDRLIVDFVKSCLEHGRHLRSNHHHGANNHQVIELHGLYTLACLFPELAEAAEWRAYVVETLPDLAARVFGADGFTRELSSSYHKLSLLSYVGVVEVAAQCGFRHEIPVQFRDQVERGFEACLRLIAPDGKLPPVNDSSRPSARRILARGSALFPDRADFRFAATRGREGAPPRFTSCFLPYAGFAALRSGFEADGNLLLFDVGPLGSHHQHQDKLNVILWAHGRELLYDGGGGSYEASRYRTYAIDTYSHNTVLVDGLAQRRRLGERTRARTKAIDARFQSTPAHDFACGTYRDPYGGGDPLPRKRVGRKIARHERRVLFLKPDVFLVVDEMHPRDLRRHTYQARWHLMSTASSVDPRTRSVTTMDLGIPNLAVVPLRSRSLEVKAVSGQLDPEILGVHVLKHRHAQQDATTVMHTTRTRGRAEFWTLLLPLPPGQTCPVSAIRREGRRGVRVSLSDGRTWSISVEPGIEGDVTLEERSPEGALIRVASSRAAPRAR